MKLHYYPETDSLYIELRSDAGVEVKEVVDGFNADIDCKGRVTGFDIDHASKTVDISTLEVTSFPVEVCLGNG